MRSTWLAHAVLATMLLAHPRAYPQTSPSPAPERAAALFDEKNWAAAAAAYEALARQNPTAPLPRLRHAVCLVNLGRLEQGLAGIDAAEKLGVPAAQADLHRARAFMKRGDRAAAFAALEKATQGGLQNVQSIEGDELFAPLKSEARYAALMKNVERNAHPCVHSVEARQFDFWIGEWDVYGASAAPGQPPAQSRIELVEDSCVIAEYYSTAGFAGRSLNVYDASTKKWRQFWVDSKGSLSQYEGELIDGKMVLVAQQPPTPPAATGTLSRMTFSKEGADAVRQFVEQSTDEGKTWSVSFDGLYKRKPAR